MQQEDRGTRIGGGNDKREQTLNQLLAEMDGFSGNSGVIVIAATNRPGILDSVLPRPEGLMDRKESALFQLYNFGVEKSSAVTSIYS